MMIQFFKFTVVGTGGFLVDSLVYWFFNLALSPLPTRLISFSSAVLFTYVFNRRFTFNLKSQQNLREFAIYFANMVLGGLVNISVFMLLITYVPIVINWPIIGIACGSIAGLFVNFLTSKILFSKRLFS